MIAATFALAASSSTLVVAQFDYRGEITLGSILLGVIVALTTVLTAAYGVKFKTAAKVAETNAELYKEQSEIYHDKAEALEKDKNELLNALATQRETIQKLEALPNLARVIELMQSTAERQESHAEGRLNGAISSIEQMMEGHEERAEYRHTTLVKAMLELIKKERPDFDESVIKP